jgi:hypothetical protein
MNDRSKYLNTDELQADDEMSPTPRDGKRSARGDGDRHADGADGADGEERIPNPPPAAVSD